jgi:hypothetical protein
LKILRKKLLDGIDMARVIVKNFKHIKGAHCESTSLKDQLTFLDFPYSEAFVFGLDATMGFGYFGLDSTFSFIMGGKQSSFTENSLACRFLGIKVDKRNFQRSTDAWTDSKLNLDQNLPLLIQCDMGYLPYYTDLGDLHFGGHFLSLIGYDDTQKVALVYDNNYDEMKEVSFEAFEQARSSTYGPKFMQPGNLRYILQKRIDGKRPPLAPALKLAIQEVVKHMRAPSMNYNGIPALELFVESIPKWKENFTKDTQKGLDRLQWIYGSIEEYGTGGAMFRNLYVQFLKDTLVLPELNDPKTGWSTKDKELITANLPLLQDAAKKWTEFATIIKKALTEDKKNAIELLDYKALHSIAQEIYPLEEEFFTKLIALKL